MSSPRRIDQLGREASQRYADDQEQLDPRFRGANAISGRTEITVSTPTFPGELEALLGLAQGHAPIASLLPPPNHEQQRGGLFLHQIAPTFGPEGKSMLQARRLLEDTPEDPGKEVIAHLVTTIDHINGEIVECNSKLGQYHKG
jgi:hypothetical protein